MSFRSRIGNFLLIIGITFILLFIYTDASGSPYFRYILLGAGLILAGLILRWIAPAQAPPSSGRFRLLKSRPKKPKEKDNDEE